MNKITEFFKKMDLTLFLTALGVLAAWTPFIIDAIKPTKLKGKLISVYSNAGTYKDKPSAMFVFKLSVVSLNGSLDLEDIDLEIKYKKKGWIKTSSIAQRVIIFFIDGKHKKLSIAQASFLNNLSILRNNEPEVGYIFATTDLYKDDLITDVKFVFKSFNNEKKAISFPWDNENKRFHDDSIWAPLDSTEVKYWNSLKTDL